jgi:superfamily II DNA or RNA helicase
VKLVLETPTRLRIYDPERLEALRMTLTYVDKKVDFAIQKHKHSHFFKQKHGPEAWQEKLDELKAERVKCLLFEDHQGYWTYSGLMQKVQNFYGSSPCESNVSYPKIGSIGWDTKPAFNEYPYQVAAKEALLRARHAGVSIGTGLGKSFIITNLVKELGHRTVVMAPSTDIAKRLYEDFVAAFGRKLVGFVGDGKKDAHKRITVAIAASLTRMEEGSKEWASLSKAEVFIADESHQCPAVTLAKVCFGLLANAPYRFFFSATQFRNDGLDMLLEAITGPIVYNMTVREGIDGGFLSKLSFTMVNTTSPSKEFSKDANEMTRAHLYYNPNVNRLAAQFANRFVGMGQQVLVLVEEIEQFTHLLRYLTVPASFAHGGVTKENKGKLLPEYHDSDPSALVKAFNAGDVKVLIGTSCVSTGTDIKANQVTINLQGGKSEIAVMQGPVGRSTRIFDRKDPPLHKRECRVIDFDVANIDVVHRHAQARKAIYTEVYGPVKEVAI